jgi:glyoxylase-like metal-dependent hydrolase (beta-lactamase superfamily II)
MHDLPSGVSFFERGWLSSNNVLIQDAEQAVLVDTGYWTHSDHTISLVKSKLQGQPLTALINTHLHSDHCGGNAALQAIFPDASTLIPPGHAEYVDSWDAEVLSYKPTGQHCPPFKKTGVLLDGDAVVVGKKTWRVHAAPGHDPHSIIILNEEDGVLISADALWQNGFGVVFPEIEGIAAFEEVAATLNIIERLKPKLVLPGHGAAFTDVSEALSRAKSRLTQFKNYPEKHASYAAKVLLKFKLLELQKSPLSEYHSWARSTQYLHILHSTYVSALSFDAWIYELTLSLEKSGACKIEDKFIMNA